jgi:D-alanyl-D-alanine carboxypeptidase
MVQFHDILRVMKVDAGAASIEALFREQVRKDPKIVNAFLLVHSDRLGVHVNVASGSGEGSAPAPEQPNYMASVGKLFTSAVVGLLHERGVLSFDDPIGAYLDADLMDGLHVYKGTDRSADIRIRHLLNQTSGLPDNFYPLFERLLGDHTFDISPREAVLWAKANLTPQAAPGNKAYYTDTNYHLLGLIVEAVQGEPFHEVLRKLVFKPLGMKHAYMLHASEPEVGLAAAGVEAGFYYKGTRINGLKGFAGIDYAGGGVVAPMEELLLFMKALVGARLVSRETLQRMKDDKAVLNPGFDYGYGIWQLRAVPLLLPAKYRSWGVLGATGAYMFYHPDLDAYLIGTFNDIAWQRRCVRFMFRVMDRLR